MKADRAIMLSALFGIVFAVNGAGAQEMKETTVKGQIFGVWAVVSVVNDVDGKRLAAIKGDEITWTNPTASIGGNTVITLQRAKSGERYPQRDEK